MAFPMLVPSNAAATLMPSAMSASNRAYSAAAAPSSSFTNRRIAFNMVVTFLLCHVNGYVSRNILHTPLVQLSSATNHTNREFPHLLHPGCRVWQSCAHYSQDNAKQRPRRNFSNELLIWIISMFRSLTAACGPQGVAHGSCS